MLESIKPCMVSKVSKELPNYLGQHIDATYQQGDYAGNLSSEIRRFQSFFTAQRNNCSPPLKDVTGCAGRSMPLISSSSTDSSFFNMNMPTSSQGQENPYSVMCQNQKFLVQDPGGHMISSAYQDPYFHGQILGDAPPDCYSNSNADCKLSASGDYTISLKFPRSAENYNHRNLHQNSSLVVDNLGGSSELGSALQQPPQGWRQPHARRNMTNVKVESDIDCSTWKGNANIFHNQLHPELHTSIRKHSNTGYASTGNSFVSGAVSSGNSFVDNVAKVNQSRSSSTRGKLLFSGMRAFLVQYHHTMSCLNKGKTCLEPSCLKMKNMISHIKACNIKCKCVIYRKVLVHYRSCSNGACNICSPVRKILSSSQPCKYGIVDPNGCCDMGTQNNSIAELRTHYTDTPLTPLLDDQLTSSVKQFPDMPEDPAANDQTYSAKRTFTHMLSDPSLDDQTNTFKRRKTKDEHSVNPCSRDNFPPVSPVDHNNYTDFINSTVATFQTTAMKAAESYKISRPSCAIELTSIGSTEVLTFDTQSSVPSKIDKRTLSEMHTPIEVNNKDVEQKSTATQSVVHASDTINPAQVLIDSQSMNPLEIEKRTPEESMQVPIEINNKDVELKCTLRQSDVQALETKIVCRVNKENSDVQLTSLTENAGHFAPQNKQLQLEVEKILLEVKQDVAIPSKKSASETTLRKKKIRGLSLIQWFTPLQVEEHLRSVKQMADQGKSSDGKNKQMEVQFDENTCQICGTSNLYFDAPAICCHLCLRRINCGGAYNTATVGDTLANGVGTDIYLCTTCCNRNAIIKCAGIAIPKTKLKKKLNDECDAEPWVQCDKCSAWQHQICSLFNDIQNDRDTPEYTCPNCYLEELENGNCIPLPQNTLLCASNLPKSKLSDHIETRLFMRLKQEREERANKQGMHFDEIPGAEGLVVRVVSSIEKKLEVKKLFHGIFEGACYPKKFPYKSKAILLFQNIGGADICIFAMYVQEYGSDCPPPNQRHVYIAYLDSVQHFSPEIKTVTGEALRTYVYHEILIGYLDYCKKRGFTCCYIWSCPSLKQEDFILHCHPRKQKMPNDIKLRKWYQTMLKKATKENIVVHTTNLYDYFFMPSSECKARETAARLPYFDGDFWPGRAEEVLHDLKRQEGGEPKKKLTKRADKAFKQNPFSKTYKDLHLLDKIGDSVHQKKENFILVHLQHGCNHCYDLIVTGNRWVCNSCEKFQLCDRCHEKEKALDNKMKHCINKREEHKFLPVEIIGCPLDTTDFDDTVDSEVFDCRISFLNFCQARHYQFDTLRHAKHSTMMLLYQHYNTASPVITISCSQIRDKIPKTAKTSDCGVHHYQISNHISHTGKPITHEFVNECRDVLSKDCKSESFWKTELVDLFSFLGHASECTGVGCSYTACRRLKLLFRHSKMCKTRLNGGCRGCITVWLLLKFHARSCDKLDCRVPRCMDIRHYKQRANEKISLQSDNAGKT